MTPPTKATFLGLSALAAYTLWRAIEAQRTIRNMPTGWHRRYVDHLGFVLITLLDGFAIVMAIDLHAPVWLIVAIAIAVVLIGRALLQSVVAQRIHA